MLESGTNFLWNLIKFKMSNLRPIKTRTGIVGIERSIQEKNRATDETISEAFQDLKILMNKVRFCFLNFN